MANNNCCCQQCAQEYSALRRQWSKCCCCKKETVKGKFGLAWIAETPNCKQKTPLGWQVEIEDTPSKVEAKCKEIVEWVNNPPLDNYDAIPYYDETDSIESQPTNCCCCCDQQVNSKKVCPCDINRQRNNMDYDYPSYNSYQSSPCCCQTVTTIHKPHTSGCKCLQKSKSQPIKMNFLCEYREDLTASQKCLCKKCKYKNLEKKKPRHNCKCRETCCPKCGRKMPGENDDDEDEYSDNEEPEEEDEDLNKRKKSQRRSSKKLRDASKESYRDDDYDESSRGNFRSRSDVNKIRSSESRRSSDDKGKRSPRSSSRKINDSRSNSRTNSRSNQDDFEYRRNSSKIRSGDSYKYNKSDSHQDRHHFNGNQQDHNGKRTRSTESRRSTGSRSENIHDASGHDVQYYDSTRDDSDNGNGSDEAFEYDERRKGSMRESSRISNRQNSSLNDNRQNRSRGASRQNGLSHESRQNTSQDDISQDSSISDRQTSSRIEKKVNSSRIGSGLDGAYSDSRIEKQHSENRQEEIHMGSKHNATSYDLLKDDLIPVGEGSGPYYDTVEEHGDDSAIHTDDELNNDLTRSTVNNSKINTENENLRSYQSFNKNVNKSSSRQSNKDPPNESCQYMKNGQHCECSLIEGPSLKNKISPDKKYVGFSSILQAAGDQFTIKYKVKKKKHHKEQSEDKIHDDNQHHNETKEITNTPIHTTQNVHNFMQKKIDDEDINASYYSGDGSNGKNIDTPNTEIKLNLDKNKTSNSSEQVEEETHMIFYSPPFRKVSIETMGFHEDVQSALKTENKLDSEKSKKETSQLNALGPPISNKEQVLKPSPIKLETDVFPLMKRSSTEYIRNSPKAKNQLSFPNIENTTPDLKVIINANSKLLNDNKRKCKQKLVRQKHWVLLDASRLLVKKYKQVKIK